MAIRFDAVRLSKVERTPEGYLRCDASIGRVGVFAYRNPDGSTRREYRPAEEVFAPASIASATGKPATDLHPGLVTARTVRSLRVGGPIGPARQDGNHLVVPMQFDDESAISKIEAGDRRDISSGYQCREDMTPGTHPVFGSYDLIQRDVVYNHFAILPPGAGRQGSDVSLRLDAAEMQELGQARTIVLDAADLACDTPAIAVQSTLLIVAPTQELRIMKIKTVAGEVEIKLDAKDEAVIAPFVASLESAAAEAVAKSAKLEAERDALKVRADAADAFQAAQTRIELDKQASAVLGADVKLDGKSDAEVRGLVIAKVFPGVRLDAKSADYVQALFDQAIVAKPIMAPAPRQDGGPEAVAAALAAGPAPTAHDARAEMLKERAGRAFKK